LNEIQRKGLVEMNEKRRLWEFYGEWDADCYKDWFHSEVDEE